MLNEKQCISIVLHHHLSFSGVNNYNIKIKHQQSFLHKCAEWVAINEEDLNCCTNRDVGKFDGESMVASVS